jgi:hypothetical protein
LHASIIDSEQVRISPTEEAMREPLRLDAEFVRARQLAFLAASPLDALGALDNVLLLAIILIFSKVTIRVSAEEPTFLT